MPRPSCRVPPGAAGRGQKVGENIEVGTMIETPAAVLIADDLAAGVRLLLHWHQRPDPVHLRPGPPERQAGAVLQPHHPAVLREIQMTIDAGHRHGIWVGICGELGADTALTETFLRMGIDELSVNTKGVLPVRKIIRSLDLSKPSVK